jgi:putative tryptophan/tyrosine transport system substrate-binding protein
VEFDELRRRLAHVGEIERAFNDLAGWQQAVLVLPESLTTVHRELIVQTAVRHRLPSVYGHRYLAASGDLLSNGVDKNAVDRRAAEYVHRIMRVGFG